MKYHVLFSQKDKRKKNKMSFAQFLFGALRVKDVLCTNFFFFFFFNFKTGSYISSCGLFLITFKIFNKFLSLLVLRSVKKISSC